MKRTLLIILALTLAIPFTFAMAFAGNGAPSGYHFNLNIIAVPKLKTALMQDDGLTGHYGHSIFVLEGALGTKILLTEAPDGETFQVLDKNGTDGEAKFMLPAADTGVISDTPGTPDECTFTDPDGAGPLPGYYVCGTGTTVYSVFARALGKRGTPGMDAKVMLCGLDYTAPDGTPLAEPLEICSIDNQLILDSHARPGKFTNVTANLLYLYNVNIDGVIYKRIPLFSDALQDYFWQYDNYGLKLLQLRFYWCETVVPQEWVVGQDNPNISSACVVK